MILKTQNISKKFGGKQALCDVTFDLEQGQVYALLGENGSGKTTWMKIVAGLTKPSGGEILFEDGPINWMSRSKIAYMSTEPYFYSWMTAEDVGNYYQDFFDDFRMDRYLQLLGKMELEHTTKVRALSSGMMAKLKIAVTMSREARLYLLDEPLNGIDLIARDKIMGIILESVSPDVTLVLSSHLVEEMEAVVSKAIFIQNGHLLELADVEDLRSRKGTSLADYYRRLMA